MDEMIENLSQIYPNLSKEVIYNHLITDFRGRSASSLDKGYDVFEQYGGDHGGVQKYPSSVGTAGTDEAAHAKVRARDPYDTRWNRCKSNGGLSVLVVL